MKSRAESVQDVVTPAGGVWVHWRDYLTLTKPRVVVLMVFTAIVGMFLASPGQVPWVALTVGSLGIALAAGSAAALNHLADQRIDAIMARTRRRPLPSGHLRPLQVLGFSSLLGVAGLGMLALWINPLTAALTFASLIGYALVYTLYLKRATPQNIVIGGAAGAAPPLLGWTAVTGSVDAHALLLFLIVFVWTPPHFWALAVARLKDYERADVPMLPVVYGERFTRWQILLYTVLLLAVSLLPWATFMGGWLYLAAAVGLGGWYLMLNVRLLLTPGPRLPMRSFRFSIIYLFGLFAALLVDRQLPVWLGA
ncbi:heme o synthase [Alkalilimnicola ehrlichii MLHE-1]|uniref:heme o synthase n=1 Tax=Alkalilimnicola ehrlichii TaxID=351052 RepID=UPI00005DFFB4|nr:heme o synthase [Alkalilimnicola ehrlichii]ABI55656.1 protoheme IX farnesyltransferase [Alkalilimnicola ehrlichii MLHE-1]